MVALYVNLLPRRVHILMYGTCRHLISVQRLQQAVYIATNVAEMRFWGTFRNLTMCHVT